MTPKEIYRSYNLGHEAPEGVDPREVIVRQFEDPVPVDEIWGSFDDVQRRITGTQDLLDGKTTMDAVFPPNTYKPVPTWRQLEELRKLARHSVLPEGITPGMITNAFVPRAQDYRNPLMRYASKPDRAVMVHMMLLEPNNWPTSEARAIETYSFWVRGLFPYMFSTYSTQWESANIDERLAMVFLNQNENRPGEKGGSQNFTREHWLAEISGGGPDVAAPDDMLNLLDQLTLGLIDGELKPEWQVPGPFNFAINGRQITIEQSPGTTAAMRQYLRWLSMDPKTAEYQIWRRLYPILGGRLTPELHGKLITKWLETGGDLKEVYTAAFLDDAAWTPVGQTPDHNLVGYVTHCNIHNVNTYQDINDPAWMPKEHIGIDDEKTPDAKGFERDRTMVTASMLMRRSYWPGTNEQKQEAVSFDRVWR